jgi:hypothetical protein
MHPFVGQLPCARDAIVNQFYEVTDYPIEHQRAFHIHIVAAIPHDVHCPRLRACHKCRCLTLGYHTIFVAAHDEGRPERPGSGRGKVLIIQI